MTTQVANVSMVSIDPAVAKEILGIANESVLRESSSSEASTVKSHAAPPRVQPRPLRRKETLSKADPKIAGRARNNSLKRVKNSNELLRQRSQKVKPLEILSETGSSTRGGHQFTVGNVGNNGMIYLRPLPAAQASKPAQGIYVAPRSQQIPDPEKTPTADYRESTWSNSLLTKHVQRPSPPTSFPLAKLPQGHQRAHSYSTIDDQLSVGSKEGAMKIVIDRSKGSRPKSAGNGIPTLDVPIPTYKLGTPRFSTHGTPGWRSSVYTRTSVSDNRASSVMRPDFDTLFPSPPPQRFRNPAFLLPPRQPSGAFSSVTRSSAALPSPGIYSIPEPIEPSIFDTLNNCMDDPSVVRYSPRTGEITAATPARIIAQISSEAFMDYELVSDFFLTYRAYLSSENVLNLLLARLKWAVNRLSDDGRIIRIRTFAALRHWILNYFLDDFIPDRNLRVVFCNQINSMFHEVQARQAGGRSDLKIILDLKRCWNGRCSIFWESELFNLDVQQEADIVPGSAEDELALDADGELQHRGSFKNSDYEDTFQQNQAKASGTWIDISNDPDGTPHTAHVEETFTEHVPLSPTSEFSIQPLSCSIPPRALRRSPPQGEVPLGPHPVPLQSTKAVQSPVTPKRPMQRPAHAHKRSGSFTDSIREDRARTDRTVDKPVHPPFQNGSLIRGHQFAPGDALVDVFAPVSPIAELTQFDLTQIDTDLCHDVALRSNPAMNPGVKTIIGSIRRALSSKQSSSIPSRSAGDSISDPSLRGKTSTLPLNVAFFNEAMREKKSGPAFRRHVRIDLLCAEIHESYQAAMAQATQSTSVLTQGIGIASGNEVEQPSPVHDQMAQNGLTESLNVSRPDQLTPGSRSIVIVDNTGHTMPAMSGALPLDLGGSLHTDGQGRIKENTRQPYRGFSDYSVSRRSSGIFGTRRFTAVTWRDSGAPRTEPDYAHDVESVARSRPSIVARSSSVGSGLYRRRSLQSMSIRLRKYSSYQSSASKRAADPGLDHTTTTISASQDSPDPQPQRLLRRRPGGDLKKFQNVHDLEPIVRRHSTGSIDGRTESAPGSILLMGSNLRSEAKGPLQTTESTQNMPPRPVSLMRTHSSTRMRPSFEAVVKNFSRIPDDEDGGLEATLMKLEGRYQPRSPDLSDKTHDSLPADTRAPETEVVGNLEQLQPRRFSPTFTEDHETNLRADQSTQSRLRASITRRLSPRLGQGAISMTGSDESYSSIPLLERGLHDESMQRPQGYTETLRPSPHYSEGTTQNEGGGSHGSHPSIEMIEETESMKRIPLGSSLPEKVSQNTSFLLDGDDQFSDLSSELSVDIIDPAEVQPRAVSPLIAPPGTALSGLQVPTHPLTHPPTPPFSDSSFRLPISQADPLHMQQQLPPTPDPSPTFGQQANSLGRTEDMPDSQRSRAIAAMSPNVGHVPFILACDSELLAQQFTVVEKAALSEIDWNDLIDLKWDNTCPHVLNWVSYLKEKDHKGIDLVIARFNLVVKWVLSEVVMTRDSQERARTIMKYIHVAAHGRRLRNYALMMQIVIGLTSTDCTRLKKTWDLVPSAEKQLLKEMELLSQPLRNFHALRDEMESTDLQEGCIPFVGLYVHDLTYNAQKPAQIATTRDGEPLINFERYRTTATIVKNLLRLIDSSSRYTFKPVEGIIDRCLWMAALPDHKIRALSQALE